MGAHTLNSPNKKKSKRIKCIHNLGHLENKTWTFDLGHTFSIPNDINTRSKK